MNSQALWDAYEHFHKTTSLESDWNDNVTVKEYNNLRSGIGLFFYKLLREIDPDGSARAPVTNSADPNRL